MSAGPKARRTPKAAETQARIRENALRLFQQKGFAETTMREVAASAGAATGAAYYYYPSKEALIMDFYAELQGRMEPSARGAYQRQRDLKGRLAALIETNFSEIRPYRALFAALFRVAGDPASPLSPFAPQTGDLRRRCISQFQEAVEGSQGVKVPADLRERLPRLLWYYYMGLILFWIHDPSPRQSSTKLLIDSTLGIVATLIRHSGNRLLSPLRRRVLDLLRVVDPASDSAL